MTYIPYLVSIVSPVLGLAEPLCLLSALSSPEAWPLIALVVAAGQTTGFALLYFFGDGLLKFMPRLKAKFDTFDLESTLWVLGLSLHALRFLVYHRRLCWQQPAASLNLEC